MEFKTL